MPLWAFVSYAGLHLFDPPEMQKRKNNVWVSAGSRAAGDFPAHGQELLIKTRIYDFVSLHLRVWSTVFTTEPQVRAPQ